MEYRFLRYSSKHTFLIRHLLPTHKTNGQFSSAASFRSLFSPMLKYAAASSMVRFDFSQMGTSFFMCLNSNLYFSSFDTWII